MLLYKICMVSQNEWFSGDTGDRCRKGQKMYKPLFHANCSLVQANCRYMIFTNTGENIAKGETDHYIDQQEASALIDDAIIDMVARRGAAHD